MTAHRTFVPGPGIAGARPTPTAGPPGRPDAGASLMPSSMIVKGFYTYSVYFFHNERFFRFPAGGPAGEGIGGPAGGGCAAKRRLRAVTNQAPAGEDGAAG